MVRLILGAFCLATCVLYSITMRVCVCKECVRRWRGVMSRSFVHHGLQSPGVCACVCVCVCVWHDERLLLAPSIQPGVPIGPRVCVRVCVRVADGEVDVRVH
jgi:hypothetical protein